MSRLTKLRDRLSKGAFGLGIGSGDLQRAYNFDFFCPKLALFDVNVFVTSIVHPQVQFTNSGEYIGFISGYQKPSDISITFLEDDSHSVINALKYWESLKLNKNTGIFYPKEVYADTATIIYHGSQKANEIFFRDKLGINDPKPMHVHVLDGFYPIQVEPISLSFQDNSVLAVNATFNVDDIS